MFSSYETVSLCWFDLISLVMVMHKKINWKKIISRMGCFFCKKDDTKKEGNCQNLNITTTQPNLNLWLGLTWLLLFTPTPPPTSNSSSTRNKGPSGLKFCMRPHLTKLTTTQQNLTLHFSGGRGMVSDLPLLWPNPKFISRTIKFFNLNS